VRKLEDLLEIYIYIIYTPNLGFGIAIFDRERGKAALEGGAFSVCRIVRKP